MLKLTKKKPKSFSGSRRNKYGAVKTNGYSSKLEAAIRNILELSVKAGALKNIKNQVNVRLTAAQILYIVDFTAEDAQTGELYYYEAKGFETAVWRIKRRLWMHYGPGQLFVFKGSYKTPMLFETIKPKRE